jgi:thioredoxin 1
MFAPVLEKASERHSDVVFAKVDTEAEQGLAQAFGIMSIPTLMVFRDQVVLYSQPGALASASLEDLIGQVRAVDMDDIQRQIAKGSVEQPA